MWQKMDTPPELKQKVLVIWPEHPKEVWIATRFFDHGSYTWITSAGVTIHENKVGPPLYWMELPLAP